MKKLMIAAAAALAMAFGAQASTYYWGIETTGDYGMTGGAPGTTFMTGDTAVYVLLASDWDQTKECLSKAQQGPVAYQEQQGWGPEALPYQGVKTGDQDFNYGTTDVSGEALNVVFVQTDASGNNYISWAETLTSTASTATEKNYNAFTTEMVQGLADGGYSSFGAVPEPTSGLLLLIGVAGLALRRRRA